jgi:hypothetical protein
MWFRPTLVSLLYDPDGRKFALLNGQSVQQYFVPFFRQQSSSQGRWLVSGAVRVSLVKFLPWMWSAVVSYLGGVAW